MNLETIPHPKTRRSSFYAFTLIVVVTLLVALPADVVLAKSQIREGFFLVYPSAQTNRLSTVPSNTDHCGVCHYNFNGGGTRNPYGLEIQNNLNGEKKAEEYSNVVWTVRFEDSDGDGFTNQTEITDTTIYNNTPTFPGLTPGNVGSVANVASDDIEEHLVPATGADTDPPEITDIIPDGGEILIANTNTTISWTATDSSGVAGISLYLSLDNGSTFDTLARGLPNTGSYTWFPANRPSTNALIQIVAVDNFSNTATNESDDVFSIISPPGGKVPTTLRDFDMPGTQPHELIVPMGSPEGCKSCHGDYNSEYEPYFTWQGSMMAHASIDPLFEANMAIANQDAPDSGDLCLRCHIHSGWVDGRSVPTSGEAMLTADKHGVACVLCHRMMDPIYEPGVSPTNDLALLASLSNPGTNFGNGMVHLDPEDSRRGPFSDALTDGHPIVVSPFHREAAFCGTCHDVSNPAFENDGSGTYAPNALDAPATDFGPHKLGPVERTYSEWLASEFNTPSGVYLPEFAGNKTNGMVATCQDCHMRDVIGYGADTNQFPTVPERGDLPLHDMTGSSTWLPQLLADLYPAQVDGAAVTAGVVRARYMLENAADLAVSDSTNAQLLVIVTNNCGHKLPTGYPEGRRMWLNVQFYDKNDALVGESGAYNPTNGVLTHDAQAKIYEVHPGIDTNITNIVNLPEGKSFHFVLNNKIFEDNRIPPRGFSNDTFAVFGGAPVGHHYDDGQYWDHTEYTMPEGATRAEVRLYFQSTSKEFVEFLRDENVTNTKGQEMYDLWSTNGMCPPDLMQAATWYIPFLLENVEYTPEGHFQVEFLCRPGIPYTIEYKDDLTAGSWNSFVANGTHTPPTNESVFLDDFTSNTSGGPSTTGSRFYRFSYVP